MGTHQEAADDRAAHDRLGLVAGVVGGEDGARHPVVALRVQRRAVDAEPEGGVRAAVALRAIPHRAHELERPESDGVDHARLAATVERQRRRQVELRLR